MAGKCFLEKVPDDSYAEIQDGHQKWQEKDCWQKVPDDYAFIPQVENFVEITLSCAVSEDKCVFVFYAEIVGCLIT